MLPNEKPSTNMSARSWRHRVAINLVTLLSIFSFIWSAKAAASSSSCSDVFSDESKVLNELAKLRYDISIKVASGHPEVAKLLYVKYQALFRDAKLAGLNLSSLIARVHLYETLETVRTNVHEVKAREALVIEESSPSLWPKAGEFLVHSIHSTLSLSTDGQRVAYVTPVHAHQFVTVRDVNMNGASTQLPADGSLQDFQINWDHGLVAIRSYKDTQMVNVYSVAGGAPLFFGKRTSAMALSKHAPILAISEQNTIYLLDARTGALLHELDLGLKTPPKADGLALSADGIRLMARDKFRAHIVDLSTREQVSLDMDATWLIALHPSANMLFVVRDGRHLELIDLAQNSNVIWRHDSDETITSLRIEDSGARLSYTTAKGALQIVVVGDNSPLKPLASEEPIRDGVFSAQGNTFAINTREAVRVFQKPLLTGR